MNKAKLIFKLSLIGSISLILLSFSCSSDKQLIESDIKNANNKYTELSTQLMKDVMIGKDAKEIRLKLKNVESDSLSAYLTTDNQKKAFWINVYNAHIQLLLREDPKRFEDRGKFFGTPSFYIANQLLSFDDVEHGIIRNSKIKLSLGLLRNPFAGNYEKQFRTKKTDGRVHFALNCGAKSCPLVAAYEAANFDEQIDEVAQNFLTKMSRYSKKEDKVNTTTLFSWFRGDFGGKKGIKNLLKKYGIIPANSNPNIEYDSYNWTLSLGNYYEK